jgi:hypothetical protein
VLYTEYELVVPEREIGLLRRNCHPVSTFKGSCVLGGWVPLLLGMSLLVETDMRGGVTNRVSPADVQNGARDAAG